MPNLRLLSSFLLHPYIPGRVPKEPVITLPHFSAALPHDLHMRVTIRRLNALQDDTMRQENGFRQKETAHVAVRTTDVVLGVECALPPGFEARGPGQDFQRHEALRRTTQRRVAGIIVLLGLLIGAWHIGQ